MSKMASEDMSDTRVASNLRPLVRRDSPSTERIRQEDGREAWDFGAGAISPQPSGDCCMPCCTRPLTRP